MAAAQKLQCRAGVPYVYGARSKTTIHHEQKDQQAHSQIPMPNLQQSVLNKRPSTPKSYLANMHHTRSCQTLDSTSCIVGVPLPFGKRNIKNREHICQTSLLWREHIVCACVCMTLRCSFVPSSQFCAQRYIGTNPHASDPTRHLPKTQSMLFDKKRYAV